MKNYRWGILGIGKIAQKFAADLALLPQARLMAAASRSEERAADFAQRHGAPLYFGSYEALAACPDVDVVYIATPHVSHCEAAIMCLEQGKAVLCEKPLAMNASQVQRMMEVAARRHVFLMEAVWTRFMPATLAALDWMQAGEIGQVKAVKADFGFAAHYDPNGRLFNPALGGGALLDIGIYPAFLALLVLGIPARIRSASAFGPSGVDEDTGMIMEYDNGAMAHLHANIRYDTPIEAQIYGDAGYIHLHSRWHHARELTLHRKDRAPEVLRFDYPGLGYQFEAAEVMRCLDAGLQESPLLPLAFSLSLARILDQVAEEAAR